MLILMPACCSGAMARVTDRCWRTAAGSWSHTVVPSATVPARLITPLAASNASTNVVLPAPDGPISATLRITDGSCAAKAESARSPLPLMSMNSHPQLSGSCGRSHTGVPVEATPRRHHPATLAPGPTYDRVRGNPWLVPATAVRSEFRVQADNSSIERQIGTARVKRGMAEMLKGGVIMDVVTPEQARIAEDAGAVAVMALERVPADIRKDGGVARMSDPDMIDGIINAVSIPVMAKARIGHFVEAQVLQALGVDYVDESEVLTPADEAHHIDKWVFTVPFVCGATNLGEALRRIAEG